ncbi:hypothetical protein [Bartonella sp. HY038]|uniref:hypothetical protein n=1 Tax=Bartonella sp. HY038 TaxID=2759660 RepID=UPI0015FB56EA|nr:hypothetical protein [Bartonella sp. HY038]
MQNIGRIDALLADMVKADKSVRSPEMLPIWVNFQQACKKIDDPSLWIKQVGEQLSHFVLPENAATLALACGGLIEDRVEPAQFFDHACALLLHYLAEFEPFIGNEPNESDSRYNENKAAFEQDLKNWHQVKEKFENLDSDEKARLADLTETINWLILPIMACIIHHDDYLEAFKANQQFIEKIYEIYYSDLIDISHLYFLTQMTAMSNPDMVVLLHSSKTGFIVRGHHIRNGFHAIELLQPFIAERQEQLKIGKANPAILVDEVVHKSLYSWIPWSNWQDEGPQIFPIILGEPAVDIWPKWQGKVVLVAVEDQVQSMIKRNWENMTDQIHVAQNTQLDFIRYLTENEVLELMEGYKAN